MGNEVRHLEDIGVKHTFLHLVEFISTDGIEVVTVKLLLEHPGVDVLVQVSSHTHVVVSDERGVSFILEEVRVGEVLFGSRHELFVI